jgi:hypothetical protein
VPQELLELREPQESLVLKECPALMEGLGQPEARGQPERREHRVQQELLAAQGLPEAPVRRDWTVSKVLRVTVVSLVPPVRLERRALLAQQALPASVLRGQLGQRV